MNEYFLKDTCIEIIERAHEAHTNGVDRVLLKKVQGDRGNP